MDVRYVVDITYWGKALSPKKTMDKLVLADIEKCILDAGVVASK
jgi:hypothetical protein